MAEDLADGEFWLPSQFLTDDDIIMDFKSDSSVSGFGFSTETETSSDDDEVLLLPGKNLLGSPQSTLCGWDHGSPTGPVSPEKEETLKVEEIGDNTTLDLLNKAAGEVAKMKLRTDKTTGTGFFDCSNTVKGRRFPPPPPPQFYSFPHFPRFPPPHVMWFPPPPQRQPVLQNKATKPTTKTANTNNRPLGLPPSAWPPLPGQAQAQAPSLASKTQAQAQPPQTQPMMRMYVGPQSVSVGTGVFLPRRVTTTAVAAEPKKKSDGNTTKTKSNKASQRRSSRPAKSQNDDIEIQLPSEWVY